MSVLELIQVGLQVALFGMVGYFTGSLLGINERLRPLVETTWPERVLAIVPGAVAFSVVLMLANILTLGAVFGSSWVVPVAVVAVVTLGWRRERGLPDIPWPWVLLAVLVLGALFLSPVLFGGSGVRTGDPPWHLGWTEQLLHGMPVPVGPAPEIARNSYPWGLHAVLATMTRSVPGSNPLIGHEALHIVLLLSVPLAGACLARRLDERAGWLGAAASSLIGGFGWVTAGASTFIASPSEHRFGADLVVASPNSVYELFPPALPRELGLVLLAAAGCACVFALRTGSRRIAVVAGAIGGLAGLVSLPMFVSGVVWLVFGALFATKGSRRKMAVTMVGTAALVMLPWAGKVLVNYVRFGGFLNTTPRLGVEWPLATALWSWGLLVFLAAGGIALAARRSSTRQSSTRLMLGFLSGSILLMILALARGAFDWEVWGNATLLHQGRIWPPLHLLGGAFGGYALLRLFVWLRARSGGLAIASMVMILGVGAISPVVAARGLTQIIEQDLKGFLYRTPDYEDGSFLRTAATHLGPDDVVEVEGNDTLAFALFQFSGVRIAGYDDPRLDGNDLRIRYRDLAREYDSRVAAGGFTPDFLVVAGARADALVSGAFEGAEWSLIPGQS